MHTIETLQADLAARYPGHPIQVVAGNDADAAGVYVQDGKNIHIYWENGDWSHVYDNTLVYEFCEGDRFAQIVEPGASVFQRLRR